MLILKLKRMKKVEFSQLHNLLLKICTQLKNILFLTGKTLDHIKHHGWDLEPYNVVGDTVSPGITSPVVSPEFVPLLSPQPTTPDLSLGGIVIRNTTLKEVELEILVIN